ncbi:hypothetical protein EDC01DRAFT_645531 [Geopyxis carbonaria]|nr:hypothetical protein EDC01DRAFT_645531 [Geopyxis carbonaria]
MTINPPRTDSKDTILRMCMAKPDSPGSQLWIVFQTLTANQFSCAFSITYKSNIYTMIRSDKDDIEHSILGIKCKAASDDRSSADWGNAAEQLASYLENFPETPPDRVLFWIGRKVAFYSGKYPASKDILSKCKVLDFIHDESEIHTELQKRVCSDML